MTQLAQRAVAFLEEQAEKLAIMRALVQEALDDVEAGRMSPFDMNEIRALARVKADKRAKTDA
ncbi:hypothetical protein OGR47_09025 [Methylocystis sp. MJC1]|jgi:hypothetical protein|uniref:hypothetical protein n=1 Tax=Methylocystis sp. MJC1 TaxID=2654282 RepID=UPI0013ECC899|nr:hypothetical protein [Methylocystis sp. MJC1]KAF2991633.1 hypothetical protein MJC1_01198 [Methylocystis sp. MJC1]MBU6527128.1 hypothetical protein [Methylocystis sp. MJC1]UZX13564.1 hypothetical protein OGR47_09025 [Methylocystis sp. MJC1]